MATIDEALAVALDDHRAGRLEAAERVYRQILAIEPNHADALHLLGVIASQVGKHDVAVEYIRRAIELKGTEAAFHNNLGHALEAQGKLDDAVACYRRALEFTPDYADALNNLGNALCAQQKPDQAVACYCRALELNPGYVEAHYNLGNALSAEGKPDQAVACYRRALELNPDFAWAHNNLGSAFKDQGKLQEAVACYRRALELNPDFADVHNNLGNALSAQEKLDEAVACYRRAVELKPGYAEAYYNLGDILNEQGKLNEAVACYRRALELKPDYAEAHNNLGNAFYVQEKSDDAMACYRRALDLKPHYAEAHYNLGNVLNVQGKLDEAVNCYRRALELKPDYTEAHISLGVALRDLGEYDAAATCWRRALELDPEYPEAHFNQSIDWLHRGDFQRGWTEYEWRSQLASQPVGRLPGPDWDGQPLPGRTIVLHAEGGFGDTLQFIRYAPLVKDCCDSVVAACEPALARLLKTVRGVDRVVIAGGERSGGDAHVRTLSLPRIFGTTLTTIPAEVPYVAADPSFVAMWRETLAGTTGFKVGIAWQGSPQHDRDSARSIPLSCFAPIAGISPVRLYSLQKGAGREQLAGIRGAFDVVDLADKLTDFSETAAAMVNLDLVITCDSSPAHLAGALGVPVWVALPFAADWRWLLERDDNPWYPTMRLFRQREIGNWPEVFGRIAEALRELVVQRSAK